MGLFSDWFRTGNDDLFNDTSSIGIDDTFTTGMDDHTINPATGLDMIDGIGSVDVGGSPFGTDIHDHNIGFD
ncbi:MAG: hypothetical protein KAT25_03740 [Sulfuriflexus sp.]|nr:hypothetical protein [Sulfuriflexus sp.]